MIIFGGESTKMFTFDTREVQNVNRQATVKTTRSTLFGDSKFANASDFVARVFGTYMYTIDASEKTLHVYNISN